MKRIGLGIVLLCAAAAISGCSAVATPVGFGTASSAFVYTHITFPSALQDTQMDKDSYKVLGEVHGTASTNNILNIASFGDCGLEKAYRDALQKSGGDAIINARVDTEATSILYLFSTVTTHVHGTAIKCNK